MFRTRRLTAVALAVTALSAPVLALAACSGSSTSSSSSAIGQPAGVAGGAAGGGVADGSVAASASAAAAPALAPQAAPRAAAAGQAASDQAAAGEKAAAGAAVGSVGTALVQVRVVRTAEVVVQVQQLATSAARVRAAALGLGGVVASEVTTFAPTGGVTAGDGTGASSGAAGAGTDLSSPDAAAKAAGADTRPATPGESVIVLRVPVNSLDSALDKVSAIGKELSRSTASQDVTADLADLGSRVKTQQASVDRVRVLLARATSMQDIVLLESQLSTREADLEALQARQASLADRADLSTLTVTLRTPEVVATEPVKDDGGFLSGLKSGWHAVTASTTIVLTVLGALLPVLVVVAVIGWPGYLLFRRRSRAAGRVAPGTLPGPAVVGPAASPTGTGPTQP